MLRKTLTLLGIVVLLLGFLGSSGAATGPVTLEAKSVESLEMFRANKFDGHLRMPRDEDIARILEEEGIPLSGTSTLRAQAPVQQFRREFLKRNPATVNPRKLEALLDKERGLGPVSLAAQVEAETPQIMSLAVPVEFPGTDTFDVSVDDGAGGCVDEEVTTTGPLHNEIAPPGPRDNNTIWYNDTTPEMYNELYFGVGPSAGVIVQHPNLGTVDLRGNTMANYYLEQSEGAFQPKGAIYPKWLQAAHSEGWYGANSCATGSRYIRAQDLVKEVVDLVNADDAAFPWQNYDGNGDGIVDNFTVIHAGMGEEAGGGAQGEFAIWSHASLLDFPTGYLACAGGSAGCPDRDIYVREYSMDPENIDIGVIAEEFGHAAFGLPDLYTTDYQNSIANWAIFEAGSWNGVLGGMQPAPFPLWCRMVIGWASPVEVNYNTKPRAVTVGQLSLRPKGTESGIKINLPDKVVDIPNPLGTGQAWWSDVADLVNNTLAHEFDLTGATAPVFSFASHWSIEEDWDYGFVEVSTDGGANWTALPDLDGILVNTDPNGNNPNLDWALTGEGEGTLRFDLSAYAGQVIQLRLRYATDMAVQWQGWWADSFSLADGATTLFADDVEAGTDGWTADGWQVVPLTVSYPRYYLAEWRNASGFDRGLKYPYQTVYSDDDEWEVDRAAYTVPGMLLYFRDTSYKFDYTLSDSWFDPPSYGPKHALIVVDSHSFPYAWSNYTYASSGANVRITSRAQPADAAFTLQKTTPFTLRLGYNPATGQYVDEPLETKTFGPRPAVSQFHDSLGYYPGLWYRPETGGLYFWQADASAVVPAQGNYTTRITWPDNSPLTDLYGADLGDTILGTGNPGDDKVQYGLHLAVLSQPKDGKWGLIEVWNSSAVTTLGMKVSKTSARPKDLLVYTLTLRNTTPVVQSFVLDAPIPANTTFVSGAFYNSKTKSIHLASKLLPNQTLPLVYTVKVSANAPKGTVITNVATVTDNALGSTASAKTTIK